MDNIVTIRSLPCPTFCFTTFSVYQTNGVMIREGNGRGLIKVITRYLFDWLEKVTINVRTSCIQAVTGLERYCYTSMSGHILGWVHTCNITAYRNTVSWQCGRGSWPRNVSKVGYAVTSVFGRPIKGMMLLRPEQVWTCNLTLHVRTCSGRNRIIPLMRRAKYRRYRVTNFWYVTRSRVPSTLSRYGVTIRGNVASVYPPLTLRRLMSYIYIWSTHSWCF